MPVDMLEEMMDTPAAPVEIASAKPAENPPSAFEMPVAIKAPNVSSDEPSDAIAPPRLEDILSTLPEPIDSRAADKLLHAIAPEPDMPEQIELPDNLIDPFRAPDSTGPIVKAEQKVMRKPVFEEKQAVEEVAEKVASMDTPAPDASDMLNVDMPDFEPQVKRQDEALDVSLSDAADGLLPPEKIMSAADDLPPLSDLG